MSWCSNVLLQIAFIWIWDFLLLLSCVSCYLMYSDIVHRSASCASCCALIRVSTYMSNFVREIFDVCRLWTSPWCYRWMQRLSRVECTIYVMHVITYVSYEQMNRSPLIYWLQEILFNTFFYLLNNLFIYFSLPFVY
jgi:hypothetical protein